MVFDKCHNKEDTVNSLPNNKFLDLSKLKAFADDKINGTQKLKFVLRKVDNIEEKGENAGYQHFLLFPQCFQKAPLSRLLEVGIVWLRVNILRKPNSTRAGYLKIE